MRARVVPSRRRSGPRRGRRRRIIIKEKVGAAKSDISKDIAVAKSTNARNMITKCVIEKIVILKFFGGDLGVIHQLATILHLLRL